MSQAKISRIERGKTLPSVIDVERILKALEVPPDAARELVGLARRANVEHTSVRTMFEIGVWRRQLELKALAESCRILRVFLPAMPSGLLQIPEYTRGIFEPRLPSEPLLDVEKIVRARLDRQIVLEDPSRRFVFLLTRHAVTWQFAEPDVMARQCAHMEELSRRPNIDLAIVPGTAHVPMPAFNTFTVYDDRLVAAELFSGGMILHDPKDICHHLELFEYFYDRALTGDQAREFLRSARDAFMRMRD
jgi:transcriptional regulator with XRE-family HTH domain